MGNPYHIIHQVFDCRDAQHQKQGHQRGVPRQGCDLRDGLEETKRHTCVPMKANPQVTANSKLTSSKSNLHHHPPKCASCRKQRKGVYTSSQSSSYPLPSL